MKRILLSAAAAAMVFAPLGVTSADARPGDNGRYQDNRGQHNDSRWDHNRHNGYFYNNQWHYGPPPAAYIGRPGFRAEYRQWKRGDRLPAYYRQNYRAVDYRSRHLRAPPRGYHYVQDDRGDIILAAIATGLIASIIANN